MRKNHQNAVKRAVIEECQSERSDSGAISGNLSNTPFEERRTAKQTFHPDLNAGNQKSAQGHQAEIIFKPSLRVAEKVRAPQVLTEKPKGRSFEEESIEGSDEEDCQQSDSASSNSRLNRNLNSSESLSQRSISRSNNPSHNHPSQHRRNLNPAVPQKTKVIFKMNSKQANFAPKTALQNPVDNTLKSESSSEDFSFKSKKMSAKVDLSGSLSEEDRLNTEERLRISAKKHHPTNQGFIVCEKNSFRKNINILLGSNPNICEKTYRNKMSQSRNEHQSSLNSKDHRSKVHSMALSSHLPLSSNELFKPTSIGRRNQSNFKTGMIKVTTTEQPMQMQTRGPPKLGVVFLRKEHPKTGKTRPPAVSLSSQAKKPALFKLKPCFLKKLTFIPTSSTNNKLPVKSSLEFLKGTLASQRQPPKNQQSSNSAQPTHLSSSFKTSSVAPYRRGDKALITGCQTRTFEKPKFSAQKNDLKLPSFNVYDILNRHSQVQGKSQQTPRVNATCASMSSDRQATDFKAPRNLDFRSRNSLSFKPLSETASKHVPARLRAENRGNTETQIEVSGSQSHSCRFKIGVKVNASNTPLSSSQRGKIIKHQNPVSLYEMGKSLPDELSYTPMASANIDILARQIGVKIAQKLQK